MSSRRSYTDTLITVRRSNTQPTNYMPVTKVCNLCIVRNSQNHEANWELKFRVSGRIPEIELDHITPRRQGQRKLKNLGRLWSSRWWRHNHWQWPIEKSGGDLPLSATAPAYWVRNPSPISFPTKHIILTAKSRELSFYCSWCWWEAARDWWCKQLSLLRHFLSQIST